MKSVKDLFHPGANKPAQKHEITVDDNGVIHLGMNGVAVECPIKNRTVEAAQNERRISIAGQDALMLQVTNVPRCNSICRAFTFQETEASYFIGCRLMEGETVIHK